MFSNVLSTAKRFGAIDVGSNALRLRVIEVDRGPATHTSWRDVTERRVPLRLGRGAFGQGRLGTPAIHAACETLRDFCREMHAVNVDSYRAVATSAVREAEDGSVLVERAERESAVRLDVIDGQEEARLVALAVRRHIPPTVGRMALVDLGGGSAEISLMDAGEVTQVWSLPLGTVRLLAIIGLGPDQGLNALERARLKRYVDGILAPVFATVPEGVARIVATGGNARALAQLCRLAGCAYPCIDVRAMRDMFHALAPLAPSTRATACSLRPDRADVIVPAASVLLRLARGLHVETIDAPDVGLKEGVLESLVHAWLDSEEPSAAWTRTVPTSEAEGSWREATPFTKVFVHP